MSFSTVFSFATSLPGGGSPSSGPSVLSSPPAFCSPLPLSLRFDAVDGYRLNWCQTLPSYVIFSRHTFSPVFGSSRLFSPLATVFVGVDCPPKSPSLECDRRESTRSVLQSWDRRAYGDSRLFLQALEPPRSGVLSRPMRRSS